MELVASPKVSPPELSLDVRSLVRGVLVRAMPLLVVYYSARLLGLAPYLALGLATLCAVAQTIFIACGRRKFDILSACMLLFLGFAFIVAMVTHNAQTTMLLNLLPAFFVDLSTLVSGLTRRPMSMFILKKLVPGLSEEALVSRGWLEPDIREYRKLHSKISVVLGVCNLVNNSIMLVVVMTVPVDLAQFFLIAFNNLTTVVLVLFAYKKTRRFYQRSEQGITVRSLTLSRGTDQRTGQPIKEK